MRSILFTVLYCCIVFLRVGIPFFIFFYPLIAPALSIFLDAIDAEFASYNVLTKHQYQYAKIFFNSKENG